MDPFLITNLTDEQLYEQLKFYKINCGPIQPTTRALYENRLKKHLKTLKMPGAVTKSRDPPLPSINGISPIRLEPEIKHKHTLEANTQTHPEVVIKQENFFKDKILQPDIIFEGQKTPKATPNKIPSNYTNQYEHRPSPNPQQNQFRYQPEPETRHRQTYETQYQYHEPEFVHRPSHESPFQNREPEAQLFSARQPQLFFRDPPTTTQNRMQFKLLSNPYNQQNHFWESAYTKTDEIFTNKRLLNLDTDALFNKNKNNSGQIYDEPAPPQPRKNFVPQKVVETQPSNLTKILLAIIACFILIYSAVTFLNSNESTVEIY